MDDKLLRAKNTDLYHYLISTGNTPVRENNRKAYFLSPKRGEASPSFEVNRVKNIWSDWGDAGAYGDTIDYVVWMNECTIAEAIEILTGDGTLKKYHKPSTVDTEIKQIDIIEERDKITNETLIEYLELQRKIPVEVANKYCSQVLFQFASSRHTSHWGVGLKNDKGGYSLRNTWFKGNTRPAGICTVTFDDMSLEVNLFEGLFDFLSYTILKEPPYNTCIVLNSLVFIPFLTDHLRIYDTINLYLDNDGPADDKIEYMFAQGLSPIDKRGWYSDYNDINDKLMAEYDI